MFSPFLPATLAEPAASQAADSVALIARQAIVDGQHEVVGYELFNRSRTGPTHTAATDMALVFTTLSHAGTEELVGDKLIFINCTHESLAGGHLELFNPEQVVLEIPPLGHAATEEVALRLPILQSLGQRGFHLAFNQTVLQSTYAAWLELADFMGLDVVLAIMNVLYDGLADSKYRPCPLLVKYVEAGWLGRKSGRGFYDYSGPVPSPTR